MRSSIFQSLHPRKKIMLPKAKKQKKIRQIIRSFTKKSQKVLMKIEEMADVF